MIIPDPRNEPDPDRDLADSVQFVSVERGGQWIRDYRERCEAEARADERTEMLKKVSDFWADRYVGGPHIYKADADDWRECLHNLSPEEYKAPNRSDDGCGGPG